MPHTYEEFENKFRSRMLGLLLDSYATRNIAPSELGVCADAQLREIKSILRSEYEYLTNDPKPPVQPAPTKGPSK